MRSAFVVFLAFHGAIHFLGFAKAFWPDKVPQREDPVSKRDGILWSVAGACSIAAAVLLASHVAFWWVVAVAGLALSQTLVVRAWEDARYGTVANVLILAAAFVAALGALPSSYENRFRAEVTSRLHPLGTVPLVRENDIRALPAPVQRYLRFCGVVGKPMVWNFRAEFRGSIMRSIGGEWMDISARQYNFFGDRSRLFYIESSLFGIPFDGLHAYVDNRATMEIKVASILQVADAKGDTMTRGETVTMFNDMCLLAPATLLDTDILWKTVDSRTVDASFTNRGYTIHATLEFDSSGALTNFRSNDRFASSDGKTYANYPWSTPVHSWRAIGGRMLPASMEAIWSLPAADETYAKFDLVDIEYNCASFR